MTALTNDDPEFQAAHETAVRVIRDAVLTFERSTQRTVLSVEWTRIDVTRVADRAARFVRNVVVAVAPSPDDL